MTKVTFAQQRINMEYNNNDIELVPQEDKEELAEDCDHCCEDCCYCGYLYEPKED
jgi:hypothetical protein